MYLSYINLIKEFISVQFKNFQLYQISRVSTTVPKKSVKLIKKKKKLSCVEMVPF